MMRTPMSEPFFVVRCVKEKLRARRCLSRTGGDRLLKEIPLAEPLVRVGSEAAPIGAWPFSLRQGTSKAPPVPSEIWTCRVESRDAAGSSRRQRYVLVGSRGPVAWQKHDVEAGMQS